MFCRRRSPGVPARSGGTFGNLRAGSRLGYLLRRTTVEVEASLPDEQAGFRKDRGTRDNILLLARIIDNTLARGEEGVAVFLDYEAAFDSVSHLFLDEALGAAGASDKIRSIFRAIYSKAKEAPSGNAESCRWLLSGNVFSVLGCG